MAVRKLLVALDDSVAAAAAEAAARSGLSLSAWLNRVDASVVVGGIARGDAIVTGDPKDLRRIAAGLHAKVVLLAP